ncbi:hypothetical protein CLOSTMETH_03398 [[Clostridium] methylpentosum DSM 5476]|uniref:Uncharacterized protein n=1 Tax=[Clostridium] methylpentosum DSM 5476 TaxID=537013 RepID=C0EHQ3_9FIRM|nr:hypothetical protein CLOSTMETH_03398 [[Clostridium] methylpentosum DSM 5476]
MSSLSTSSQYCSPTLSWWKMVRKIARIVAEISGGGDFGLDV